MANEHEWPERGAEIFSNAYKIIRKHAPDTMLLLFSFASTYPPEAGFPMINGINSLVEGGIPWSNEAIAFHSYESVENEFGVEWFIEVIDAFTGAGYPIINTEVPNRYHWTHYPDIALLRAMEERGISWLAFLSDKMISLPTHWRGQFEAEGLTWRPDYGDWPKPDAVYPFVTQDAAHNIAAASATIAFDQELQILELKPGDFVTYRDLNFGSREPLSFRLSVQSSGAGTILVKKGGSDGEVLGKCEVAAGNTGSGEYVVINGDILNAVSGLSDITFVFEGEGALLLRDWQFLLPKQVSYTDSQRIIQAANYPFRIGDIVRRPSTDPGSYARWEVGGITDASALIFDFVRFPRVHSIPFNIRAKPIANGTIEVYAGQFSAEARQFTHEEYVHDVFELGSVKISGEPGVWADFSFDLDYTNFYNHFIFDDLPRWELALVFRGEDREVTSQDELFVISEFYIGHEKPEPAETLNPMVMTGTSRDVSMVSAVIEGNHFTEIIERDIVEVGVMYGWEDNRFSNAIRKAAADTSQPFTVTLDLRPGEEFQYCAYVETKTGFYRGGVRRVFTMPDTSALKGLYDECVNLVESDYTGESWIPFAKALLAAKELLERNPMSGLQWEFTLAFNDLTHFRYWLTDANHAYTLTVIGGKFGGPFGEATNGVFSPWHHISVIADKPEPGKRFVRWEAKGIELSDEETVSNQVDIFIPYKDVTLTAIFEDIMKSPGRPVKLIYAPEFSCAKGTIWPVYWRAISTGKE
jgi:hypothetical protein